MLLFGISLSGSSRSHQIFATRQLGTSSVALKTKLQFCVIDSASSRFQNRPCIKGTWLATPAISPSRLPYANRHRQNDSQHCGRRPISAGETSSLYRSHIHSRNFTSSSIRAHNMSAQLIPSNPADLMVIRNVTPNIATFSVPFSRFGKVKIGGRGTLGRFQFPCRNAARLPTFTSS